MTYQKEITLRPLSRGFHIITQEVLAALPHPLPATGMLNKLRTGTLRVLGPGRAGGYEDHLPQARAGERP